MRLAFERQTGERARIQKPRPGKFTNLPTEFAANPRNPQ
jgi:hypothetical protein